MARITLDTDDLPLNADWEGNNAAFTCTACGKVFIVSGLVHKKGRRCPKCQRSVGHVSGGRKSGGSAYLDDSPPSD